MAVDITGLSLVMANMLGVSEAAGGAIVTFLLWFSVALSTAILFKGNIDKDFFLVEAFFMLGIGTLIGWLDYWWIMVLVALRAIFGAFKIGDRAG